MEPQAPSESRADAFVGAIHRWAFVALLLLIVAAYFYRLGSVPSGLFVDEASDGFNARAILKTGADEYGATMPLFFRSFDDYKSPIHVYSITASVAVFGPTPFAVRLPSALYAFGMALGLYFFLRAFTRRELLSRWLALLSLLIPAIFTYGRHAVSEGSTLPFYFVLSLIAVWAFGQRPTWLRAFLAGASIGVVTYTYTTSRLLAPLIVAACVLCFWGERPARRKLLALVGGAGLVALPMALFMLLHPHTLDLRFNTLSAWRDHPSAPVLAGRIATNYFEHLSFGFLFRTGDPNPRHSIGVGLLPLWLLAPLLGGLWSLWRRRSTPMARLLLALVAISPIPVSLCDGVLLATRMLHFAPLALIIGAVALADFLELARPRKVALALALCVAVGEGAFFVGRYFTDYARRAQPHFDEGIGEALRIAFAARRGDEPLYAPPRFFHTRSIFVSFFGDLEPTWRSQRTLDQLRIFPLGQKSYPQGALVIMPGAAAPPSGTLLGRSPSARDGAPLWSVYRIE